MAVFVESIAGVLIILGLICVGYFLASWFDEKQTKLLARLVTQVSLPCYMVDTIMQKFDAHSLIRIIPDLGYPVLSMVILLGVALVLVRICRISQNKRGLFVSMFFNSNTVFVGLPINQALFGDKSIPYVLIYYMANTTLFWTWGTYFIQRDANLRQQFSITNTLKKIFSPPLLGFMLGVVLVLTDVSLPSFISKDLMYLGNLTVPLSMIFIGISVKQAGLNHLTFQRENLLVIIGRFVCAPLLMMLLLHNVMMPTLMKQVFVLQAAMPVMTNAPVVAKLYGADSDYAAIMVTETTLLSLIVVPILMVLVQGL